MLLSTKGRYAVMAMVDLAAHYQEKPISLQVIAERQHIALNYLEQIFMKLRKAGLVSSIKGPGGGYLLSLAPENIYIAEIVAAVNEQIKMTKCTSENQGCMKPNTRCMTHHLWEELDRHINKYLSLISLKDVHTGNVKLHDQKNALVNFEKIVSLSV
jgi:Rrf2 family iron-sulfur cluster assembly transcriptional regulator